VTSTTPKKKRESSYLRHEATQSRSAMNGSVGRIAHLIGETKPVKMLKRHPVAARVGAAGLALVLATLIMRRPRATPPEIPAKRPGRISRFLRFSVRLALNNLVSNYIMTPAMTEPAPASDEQAMDGNPCDE
jgi:hypothetical protein